MLNAAQFSCFLFLVALSSVRALSCPPVCNQKYCTTNTSTCLYGTTLDACACCSECAKGPGETCGGVWGEGGRCTSGTECLVTVPHGSTYSTYLHTLGHCTPDDDNTTSEVKPSLCLNVTTSSIIISPSQTSSLIQPTPTPIKKKGKCRSECSYSFCSDGNNKYCSANKTAFRVEPERGECQHTTCRACRIFVYPDCPRCPIPVKKRCLRHYFLCIAEHYKRSDIVLELHDKRASIVSGEIICNVPRIPLPEESGDGEEA